MPRSSPEVSRTVSGIVQLANLLTRRLAPVLGRYRITPQQWGVLSTVSEAGEQPTMAEISRNLMVSKQNITGMVSRLEALGLVRRAADPADLRAVRIALTRKGEGVVREVAPLYSRWIESSLAELSASERKTLSRAVDRLARKLNEE